MSGLFDPFPVLRTERLILRQATLADTDALFAIKSSRDVLRYAGKHPITDRAEIEEKILDYQARSREGTSIWWAFSKIEDGPGSPLIGGGGFWRWTKEHYRAEIGYEMTPAEWGKGYMTEALRAVVRYGFEVMDLHSIEANVHPDNQASIRVLEKLGFVKEGHTKQSFYFDGAFEDTGIYGLVRP